MTEKILKVGSGEVKLSLKVGGIVIVVVEIKEFISDSMESSSGAKDSATKGGKKIDSEVATQSTGTRNLETGSDWLDSVNSKSLTKDIVLKVTGITGVTCFDLYSSNKIDDSAIADTVFAVFWVAYTLNGTAINFNVDFVDVRGVIVKSSVSLFSLGVNEGDISTLIEDVPKGGRDTKFVVFLVGFESRGRVIASKQSSPFFVKPWQHVV